MTQHHSCSSYIIYTKKMSKKKAILFKDIFPTMGYQYSENKNESFSKTIVDIIRQKYDLGAEGCVTISVGEDEWNFVQDCTSYEEFLSDLLKDDNNLLYYKHFPHGVSDGFQLPSRVKKYTWLLTRRLNLILTQFHQQNR